MRYLFVLSLILVAWLVLTRVIPTERLPPGSAAVLDRLKSSASRWHRTIGILATLVLMYFVVAFVVKAIGLTWTVP
jgi:hypothetical protein